MRRIYSILFFVVVITAFMTGKANAAPPSNFQTTQIIGSDIDVTTGFDFAPDGRIFILERTGTVKIYKNGHVLTDPFIQLNSVTTGDRGLTGIAFDPDFNNNHYVYFYFTGSDNLNRLVRVDATGDTASGSPVTIYKTSSQSLELHIGGTIRFGPDGKLYVSIGDNGTGSNAQDLSTPFGKILRLNKDGSIPSDNPFVGQAGKLPEIWAYGMRNPYRFQFDQTNGRLFVGDVGNDSWEEVNLISKGGNYGWPTCEGLCNNPDFINPVYTYPHNGSSSSVTGGFIYRGNMFPTTYLGKYFFADYARGFIKNLTLDENGNSTGVADFDPNAGTAVDLKLAPDGSLYYITYFPARLYRVSYSTTNQVPNAKSSADITNGNNPLTVHFSSFGSSDPEGVSLTYSWNFGDGSTSTEANPTKTYNNKGRYTVELTVSDGTNNAQAIPIIIQAGTPPSVNIDLPTTNTKYKAGDTINYSASGADANGQLLPSTAYTTEILFHHDTHAHPFLGPIESKSGEFNIPVIGEPDPDTYFEIKITGKDSDGLTTTKSVEIFPEETDITFTTNPTNLQILLDDIPTNTPLFIKQVVNFQRNISTPVMQKINGEPYIFSSWSDGGIINHTVSIPSSPITYTANYSKLPTFKGEYFNNKTLTGIPVLTRQDKEINFILGESSPGPGVNNDNFSVRWTNSVFFSQGTYRFTTTSDDGVRLYIDNQLIIDKWKDQSSSSYFKDISLSTGNHSIKMEYYDAVFDATAILSWELLLPQNDPNPTPTLTPTPTSTLTSTPTPTSNPNSPTPTNTPTPTTTFSGYKGEYWNTPSAGSSPTFPTSSPTLTRNDNVINFNWGEGSPDPLINVNKFAARWTKTMNFDGGTYRFNTAADDGVRIYIDNQLILDKWIDQPPTNHIVDKTITAGSHEIKVEYYENSYGAVAIMNFTKIDSNPVTPTPTNSPTPTPTNTPTPTPTKTPTPTPSPTLSPTKTPTPSPTKSPTPTPTLTPIVNGLVGQYFDNINLTTQKLTRTDANINFNWGEASPNSAIGADTFSVRWTGKVQPEYSQTYTFYTTTDDGVRLWVNNQLIIDKWVNQSSKEWSGTIALQANQKYDIKLEYFDNTYDAVSILKWSSASRSKQVIPSTKLFTN